MNTILDYEDDPSKSDKKSKKSFQYFGFAVILFLILILLTILDSRKQSNEYIAFGVLGFMLFGKSILGFKNTIQCLIAEEKMECK